MQIIQWDWCKLYNEIYANYTMIAFIKYYMLQIKNVYWV
jgi:hypothetical protein